VRPDEHTRIREQRCVRCGAVVVEAVDIIQGRARRRRMEHSVVVRGHLALQESMFGELPVVVAVAGIRTGWRAHGCGPCARPR
jgi:hypothetical protein